MLLHSYDFIRVKKSGLVAKDTEAVIFVMVRLT